MRVNHSEKKAIRTVRRKRVKDLLAVLFFLLLLPYTCSVLLVKPAENVQDAWLNTKQEYLVGVLAGSIPGDYREETLKAQAVILRSSLYALKKEASADGTNTGEKNKDTDNAARDFHYLDSKQRRMLWQETSAEYEAAFAKAVQDTDGIVLTYEGELISPPYFRMSAGQTRDNKQIWDGQQNRKETVPVWCSSVMCPHNLEAEDFLQSVTVKRSAFLKKMEEEGCRITEEGTRLSLTRDSAGYVVFVDCGGKRLEGERFRTLFGLASANFQIREKGENIIFVTKGIGHGLGFDQYAADLLAAEGKDYQQLLAFFFQGITLEKVE